MPAKGLMLAHCGRYRACVRQAEGISPSAGEAAHGESH